jgi:hypothetical protein
MINLYELVPTVYSQASRDFQYLSWLINIVLNSVKHNVDGLYDLPNSNVDSKLSELLAFTLGFKIRRNYDKDQLLALVNIIPSLLKYKGTRYALELAGNTLIKSSGAVGDCVVIDDDEALNNGIIKLFLPKDLIDTSLFIDLLPYILPAGMTCSITRKPVDQDTLKTVVNYRQDVIAHWHEDVELEDNQVKGVSSLFEGDVEVTTPTFTNYNADPTIDEDGLNVGLLSNAVIPILDESL